MLLLCLQFLELVHSMDPTHKVLAKKSSDLTLESFWKYYDWGWIYFMPQIVCTLSFLLLFLFITRKKNVIIESLSLSLMARCTLRAIMITSWIFGIVLLAQHFLITYYVDEFIDQDPFLLQFKDFFKMQTKLLYAQFISICTIVVMELPPVLILSYKIYIKLINLKSSQSVQFGYNSKAFIGKVAIFSFGFIGIFLYTQIQLVFLFNMLFYIVIIPFNTMWRVAWIAEGVLLPILILTHLQIFIINAYKRRKCLIPLIKLLIVVLSGTVTSCILVLLFQGHQQTEQFDYNDEYLNISSATNSIISSVILGIMSYLFKKVIYQKVKKEVNAGRDEYESHPLIQL